jgi:DNA polymerase I-like protein with 3'-5' exonuclease and polymerase domains
MIDCLSLDLETLNPNIAEYNGKPDDSYALQPWRDGGKISILSLSMGETAKAYLWPTKPLIESALQYAYKNNYYICGWNVAFDISWILALYPELKPLIFKIRWIDGILIAKRWDRMKAAYSQEFKKDFNRGYGLKQWVNFMLPEYTGYNKNVEYDIPVGSTLDNPATKLLYEYAKIDSIATLKIVRKCLSGIPQNEVAAIKHEASLMPYVAMSNLRGVNLDLEAIDVINGALTVTMGQAKALLPNMTERQLASPSQLSTVLFDEWNLPILRYTAPSKKYPMGNASIDKYALTALKEYSEDVEQVLIYRVAKTLRDKFAAGLRKSADYNGGSVVHPITKIASTYTGRATVTSKTQKKYPTGIPMHQTPRDSLMRSMIKARKGYKILEFDFKGQEMRWMSLLSNDITMMRLYLEDIDPHTYMGAAIGGISYEELCKQLESDDPVVKARAKELRTLGKIANLSLQYRTGYRKLSFIATYKFGIPVDEYRAEELKEIYLSTFPGVENYWETAIAYARKHKYAQTIGGRKLALTVWWGADTWKSEQAAINFPIQGVGADQKHLAMATVFPYVDSFGGYFLFELHDGIYFEFPEDIADEQAVIVGRMLSNLPYEEWNGFSPAISFPVDCKIGDNWGHLKEVKL